MRAAFHTLGCKTNAYETQAIQEQFQNAGFEIGAFSQPCDVYVINTCAVTQEAARKSRQMAGRCRRNNPDALIVVTGCYAQEAKEGVLLDSSADIVVGNGEKNRILSLVLDRMRGDVLVKDLSQCRDYEEQSISRQEDHVRAYVKIQDGCDRFCSYCLIPFLRGRSRSRRIKDVITEVATLASGGFREVVLTGIDISSYDGGELPDPKGRNGDCEVRQAEDVREHRNSSDGDALAGLIEEIGGITGVQRIRLGSLEVRIVQEEFLERLSRVTAFCPQFHLSLQSGCDSVLKRMNRHYTVQEFSRAVSLIRRYFPGAAVTTDIITGFPGESEEEFRETVRFTRQIAFSRLHVFPFSRRKGTRADQMNGQLTKAVKEARARELIAEGEALRAEYEQRLIGTSCRILVEECVHADPGCGERLYLAGYTPEYVHILADAALYVAAGENFASRAENMVNQMIDVVPNAFLQGMLMQVREEPVNS